MSKFFKKVIVQIKNIVGDFFSNRISTIEKVCDEGYTVKEFLTSLLLVIVFYSIAKKCYFGPILTPIFISIIGCGFCSINLKKSGNKIDLTGAMLFVTTYTLVNLIVVYSIILLSVKMQQIGGISLMIQGGICFFVSMFLNKFVINEIFIPFNQKFAKGLCLGL